MVLLDASLRLGYRTLQSIIWAWALRGWHELYTKRALV
jgi:hypothetical protein